MQSASPGEDAALSAGELADLLGLDLSEPLGPACYEGVGPNATGMDGGDDYPEWTASDLIFEPYAMNLLYPLEDVSSNANPPDPTVQGTTLRWSTGLRLVCTKIAVHIFTLSHVVTAKS